MSDNSGNIIWIDVETTGLGRPKVEDHLLEVGLRATDRWGDTIADALYMIPSPGLSYFAVLCKNEYVRKMHEESGLWRDYDDWICLMREERQHHDALLDGVEDDLFSFFGKYVDGKTPLAGSSLDFDRNFLREYFPVLCDTYISHRVLDVSSMFEFCKLVNPELYKKYEKERNLRGDGKHRPMEDLDDTIWGYKFAIDNFLHVYLPE